MERTPVSSSNIASVGYDESSERLEIEFLKTGQVYEYYNVPSFVYEGLVNAPSVGAYFNAEIKGSYAFNPL